MRECRESLSLNGEQSSLNGVPSPEFWRGRRVFVTGHTGFKGSWLSLWLHAMGASVTGFSLPPSDPSLFEAARIGESVTSVIGDVLDLDGVCTALQAAKPEVLFHLAAQPIVRLAYNDPVGTFAVNVLGTVHVLEAARRIPSLKAVVVVTSDKCYANRGWLWGYREDEAMGGHDPYSSSKGCAELVTAAYRSSFFTHVSGGWAAPAVASARAGNVIGGGDWAPDRLVPDAIRAFFHDRPVVIRNPHAVRPWQHVLEPLSGYLVLAARLLTDGAEAAEGWNFGPETESERTVAELLDMLTALWGEGAAWKPDPTTNHPAEAALLALDSAKARHRLGWRPTWTLSEALAAVVRWYRAYRDGTDVRAVMLSQIADFTAAASRPGLEQKAGSFR